MPCSCANLKLLIDYYKADKDEVTYMATIKLRLLHEGEAYINFHVPLDGARGGGYETSVELLNKDGNGWTASMSFDDMPPQTTPEEAIDRMGLYLRSMAKAMKGKNIKSFNIDKIFLPIHK